MDVFETAQLKGSLKYATASELDELLSAFRSQQEMTDSLTNFWPRHYTS